MSSPPVRFASLAEAMAEMEKEDQNACWAVAQGGQAAGRAGAKEPDGVLAPNMEMFNSRE